MGAEHFYPYKGVDASGDMDADVERWVAGLWVPLMRAVANVKVRSGETLLLMLQVRPTY